MSSYFALPFSLTPITKVSYILDRLTEHQTFWTDFITDRRERAAAVLTYPENVIYEVWRKEEGDAGVQPVGLVIFDHIEPHVNCQMHPVFFDGRLNNAAGKRRLVLSLMAKMFQDADLHRMSLEIPEFASTLIRYARKHLGFRFEAERRQITYTRDSRRRGEKVVHTPTSGQAALGSRKVRIVRYRDDWHDLILLSLLRDEFTDFVRTVPWGDAPEAPDGILREACPPAGGPPGLAGDPQ